MEEASEERNRPAFRRHPSIFYVMIVVAASIFVTIAFALSVLSRGGEASSWLVSVVFGSLAIFAISLTFIGDLWETLRRAGGSRNSSEAQGLAWIPFYGLWLSTMGLASEGNRLLKSRDQQLQFPQTLAMVSFILVLIFGWFGLGVIAAIVFGIFLHQASLTANRLAITEPIGTSPPLFRYGVGLVLALGSIELFYAFFWLALPGLIEGAKWTRYVLSPLPALLNVCIIYAVAQKRSKSLLIGLGLMFLIISVRAVFQSDLITWIYSIESVHLVNGWQGIVIFLVSFVQSLAIALIFFFALRLPFWLTLGMLTLSLLVSQALWSNLWFVSDRFGLDFFLETVKDGAPRFELKKSVRFGVLLIVWLVSWGSILVPFYHSGRKERWASWESSEA